MKLDHPFFSTAQHESPLMWNWNHVMVRYCDGAYFSGHRPRPVRVGGASLNYAGYNITVETIEDLDRRYHLRKATDVVFSGCSAGGIRIYAHLDFLRGMLPLSTRVVGLADSGFYLDKEMFTPLKRFVITGQQATTMLKPQCLHENRGSEERCLIAEVVAPYLETQLFAWQSRYDMDQRSCEMNTSCAASPSCVGDYGHELTSKVHSKLLSNHRMGAFIDSCSRHCETSGMPKDDSSSATPLQAFALFYEVNMRVFGQHATYPCDSCCSERGILQFLLM